MVVMRNQISSSGVGENEERRNKILRARYGVVKANNSRSSRNMNLFVVGQNVNNNNNGNVMHANEYFAHLRAKNTQAMAGLRRPLTPLGVTVSTMDNFRLIASGIQLPHFNQSYHGNVGYQESTYPPGYQGKIEKSYRDAIEAEEKTNVKAVQQKETGPEYYTNQRISDSRSRASNTKTALDEAKDPRRSPIVTKAPQSSPTLDRSYETDDVPLVANKPKQHKHGQQHEPKGTLTEHGKSPVAKSRPSPVNTTVIIPGIQGGYDESVELKSSFHSNSIGDIGSLIREEIKSRQAYESSYTQAMEESKTQQANYEAFQRLTSNTSVNEKRYDLVRRSTSPHIEKSKTPCKIGLTKSSNAPRAKVTLKKATAGKSCPALDLVEGSKPTHAAKTSGVKNGRGKSKKNSGSKSKSSPVEGAKKADKVKTKVITVKQNLPYKPSASDLQDLEIANTRRFLNMPKSRPKAVCFDVEGIDITHLDVRRAVEVVIPEAYVSGAVSKVQFENTNVMLRTAGCKNRWIVEFKDFMNRNKVIKNGLCLNYFVNQKIGEEEGKYKRVLQRQKVDVKLYDTATMEEYKLFLRRTAAEEKLQSVILLSAGRGGRLLTNML